MRWGSGLEESQNIHYQSFQHPVIALADQNCSLAIDHFEKALAELPQNWLMRQATTLIPLAVTYVYIHERDASLAIAEKALPVVWQLNAPTINKMFIEYIQQGLLAAFPRDSCVVDFTDKVRQQLPALHLQPSG